MSPKVEPLRFAGFSLTCHARCKSRNGLSNMWLHPFRHLV